MFHKSKVDLLENTGQVWLGFQFDESYASNLKENELFSEIYTYSAIKQMVY